ncbi:copper chaperone PCu(A)C [Paenochrobactrum sp. BZR 588]|uniref:copper chaperone PCu(A)C n=1 Tax=unclassified Paenochrobactrum TaxID=2639760 RepID=UPI0038555A7D
MMLRFFAATSAALLISLSAAHAHSPSKPAPHESHGHADAIKLGDLSLAAPTVRASVPGASVAGGYILITNNGKEADRLVAASTPTADHVEIHEMSMENDVMKMRQLKNGLEIPAGETVELKSGGYHLMLMKPAKPYVEGTTVPVTLEFEKAGKVDVEFNVTSAKGKAASEHSHH